MTNRNNASLKILRGTTLVNRCYYVLRRQINGQSRTTLPKALILPGLLNAQNGSLDCRKQISCSCSWGDRDENSSQNPWTRSIRWIDVHLGYAMMLMESGEWTPSDFAGYITLNIWKRNLQIVRCLIPDDGRRGRERPWILWQDQVTKALKALGVAYWRWRTRSRGARSQIVHQKPYNIISYIHIDTFSMLWVVMRIMTVFVLT